MKIVIIGGGPCGLGAAWRLSELGHDSWSLFEKNDHVGGLSASYTDSQGFVWDVGGHVLFSHYQYFDDVMDQVLDKESQWLHHKREAYIWMQERFVPYPLQNNIHRLPKEVYWECLKGAIDIQNNHAPKPADFGQWIDRTFGKGIAKWFLKPYNFKVWAYPPETMDWTWVGDRVAPIDLTAILKSAVFETDDMDWGPNAFFRFPKYGGTGAIWNAIADRLPSDKVRLNQTIERIDTSAKTICFADGQKAAYDVLLSTMPLTSLLDLGGFNHLKDSLCDPLTGLKHSSTHIVGLAIKGQAPDHLATKCWMYFPEDNCPFYRVTVFSNYSPNNVVDNSRYWSLMCEVSQSPAKPVAQDKVVQDVIDGAVNTGLIESPGQVGHHWRTHVEHGYPTPALGRDSHIFPVLTDLARQSIYSRGRFGGWRYEVGNMDHSFMQGVEFANQALFGANEMTLWYPNLVNQLHPTGKKV